MRIQSNLSNAFSATLTILGFSPTEGMIPPAPRRHPRHVHRVGSIRGPWRESSWEHSLIRCWRRSQCAGVIWRRRRRWRHIHLAGDQERERVRWGEWYGGSGDCGYAGGLGRGEVPYDVFGAEAWGCDTEALKPRVGGFILQRQPDADELAVTSTSASASGSGLLAMQPHAIFHLDLSQPGFTAAPPQT